MAKKRNIPIRPQAPTFAHKNIRDRYCLLPFTTVEIMLNGDVRMCGCANWMPAIVGNVFQQSLAEILASPLACDIRQSIVDGDYRFCDESNCGVLQNNALTTWDRVNDQIRASMADTRQFVMPYAINISGDLICNLSCPSCRTGIIKVNAEDMEQYRRLADILYRNIFSRPTTDKIILLLSTSGEVFASPLLLNFINNIDLEQYPGTKLHIQTNGLLAESRWHRLGHMQDRVIKVTMTLDAARAESYEVIRRGGLWKDALASLAFLQNKKQQLGFEFSVRMIVQDRNWQEVREFYDICRQHDADLVEYTRLQNWHTWNPQEFRANDVFDHAHPQRAQALQMINSVRELPGVWLIGDYS